MTATGRPEGHHILAEIDQSHHALWRPHAGSVLLNVHQGDRPPFTIYLSAHKDGAVRMWIKTAAGQFFELWDGTLTALEDGRVDVETRLATSHTERITAGMPLIASEIATLALVEMVAGTLEEALGEMGAPAWLPEALETAQQRANSRQIPFYVFTDPDSGNWLVSAQADHPRLTPIAHVNPDPDAAPPLDRLADFRDLAIGAPLYDRASGRQIGRFEGLTSSPIGESVQLHSDVTNHTAWSSGLAITPIAPFGPGDCRP